MKLNEYCADLAADLAIEDSSPAWEVVDNLEPLITAKIATLNPDEYVITDGVAIHKTAKVEPNAQIKAPAIISPKCFVSGGTLLRAGVYLGEAATIGQGGEIRRAYIGNGSALGHLNFVGDSIIGSSVNLEAGAMVVNHLNERADKTIYVVVDGKKIATNVTKFGALIGDGSKLGANSVTSPGTILPPGSIVGRLALVDQVG
jgi:NDP-sugar pyrophosphorylase family protein